MSTPLVTVVTPVRNGRLFLPELIQSVAAQDYPNIEHIVVDGGSTDGTLEILRAASGLTWLSEPDRGMYDAINKGFRLARGDILAYMNADDRYVVPDAVSSAVGILTTHAEIDVVYGDYRLIDMGGRVRGVHRSPEYEQRALTRYNFVPPHSTFVRRRMLDAGHWLDGTLEFPGDWDWFLGMALAGRRFRHLPKVLSEFRLHERSKTRTLSLSKKLRDWRRVCHRHSVPLMPLIWCEFIYVPLRRRLARLGKPKERDDGERSENERGTSSAGK